MNARDELSHIGNYQSVKGKIDKLIIVFAFFTLYSQETVILCFVHVH